MARLARLLLLFFLSVSAAVSAAELPSDAPLREEIAAGEYEKALDPIKSQSELFPYDQSLKGQLAKVYALIAQQELKLGHYTVASSYLAKAQELFPDSTDLILARGVALYLAKEYDSARTELERLGELPAALMHRGRVSYDTGDLLGALTLWRRALELEPGNAVVKNLVQKVERELPVESRMDRGYSSMFDISFDAELPSGLSAEVLDALESAYAQIGGDFERFPTRRVPVLLYTKKDFTSVTAGPDWSGGLYDGKIRLPLGNVTKMTQPLRAVLFHEYTHVLIADIAGRGVPTWLNEGLAEYEGRSQFNYPDKELERAGKDGKLLGLATVTGPFLGMGSGEAALAYQQSHSMVKFLLSNYGWQPVREILKSLCEKVPADQAFKKALANWALDLPGFVELWKKSLNNEQ